MQIVLPVRPLVVRRQLPVGTLPYSGARMRTCTQIDDCCDHRAPIRSRRIGVKRDPAESGRRLPGTARPWAGELRHWRPGLSIAIFGHLVLGAAAAPDPEDTAACIAPDNRFDSIMALDLKTGAIRWNKRAIPFDAWTTSCLPPPFGDGSNCPQPEAPDYDFGQAPAIFRVNDAKGRSRDLVGARPEERPILGAQSRHTRGGLGHRGRPRRHRRRSAMGFGNRRQARIHSERQQQRGPLAAAERGGDDQWRVERARRRHRPDHLAAIIPESLQRTLRRHLRTADDRQRRRLRMLPRTAGPHVRARRGDRDDALELR